MKIKCIRAFGNFVPGDELDVPADCTFDTYYFEVVAAPAVSTSKSNEGGDK